MGEKTVTRADSELSGKLNSLVASERDLEVWRESRAVRHRTYLVIQNCKGRKWGRAERIVLSVVAFSETL